MLSLHHDKPLSLHEMIRVAFGEAISLDEGTAALLDERRAQIVSYIQNTSQPSYGFNRGFGHNVDDPVAPERLMELQQNLIRSHACGFGDPSPKEVVRLTMLLRAISLSKGHSGVRSRVVRQLVDFLNHDLTPVVPRFGSVGASGDLAPLSHVALGLIGEGEILYKGETLPAEEALKAAGVEALQLEMKEGLALNNGVQFSNALAILAHDKLSQLLKTSCVTTAISTQVMLGSRTPFSPRIHALRPHPGALTVASWVDRLMEQAPIHLAHQNYDIDGEIQDPYNIRCAGQILGACKDLLDEAEKTLLIEAHSVTDNPLLVQNEETGLYTDVLSGGNFHGMPLAVKIYSLMQVIGILARLSNMRQARFVDQARNKGLGSDLKWPGMPEDIAATSSSMMIPEYAGAALTNYIWGQCMPNHLMSISTDAGQEDHVSMSAGLGVKVWETLPRLAELLAIELAYGTQAAAIRRDSEHIPSKKDLHTDHQEQVKNECEAHEASVNRALGGGDFHVRFEIKLDYHWKEEQRRLSEPCEAVLREVEAIFPTVTQDRYMSEQLRRLAAVVFEGTIADKAESFGVFEE